jgi:microcystin degradation protein MlrC
MKKDLTPVTAIAKRPQLRGLDGGKTFAGSPMQLLIDRGEKLEASGDVLVVSICAGFTGADIYEIGPSVTVTVDANKFGGTDAARSKADNTANEFMDYIWETRAYQSEINKSIPEAINIARAHQLDAAVDKKPGPLVIADVSDNPGSGHYGDATDMLRAMIEADLEDALLYAIFDPEAVKQGVQIGIGNEGVLYLGGKTDPVCGGGPLVLEGTVVTLSSGHFPAFGPMGGGVWQNLGISMLFRVGRNIDIAVISNNAQLLDISQVISLGIQPQHKKTIVVKSKHHFRASLSDMASSIICVDGGGLGTVILTGGNYVNVRRPIWPLDDV